MNIKQQQQIRAFLIREFGEDKGSALFSLEESRLDVIIAGTENKTKNQMKTLTQTILPRVALYKALQESDCSEEEVEGAMRRYMLDVVAVHKHRATARMEWIPGFYAVYSRVFLWIMRTTDLQVSTQKSGSDYYDITIQKCLWHTACVENGCPELCRLFCDVDDVTYGGLQKIGFSRSQTLGDGGSCCYFHFFRK